MAVGALLRPTGLARGAARRRARACGWVLIIPAALLGGCADAPERDQGTVAQDQRDAASGQRDARTDHPPPPDDPAAGGGTPLAASGTPLGASVTGLDAAVGQYEIVVRLASDVLFDFDRAEIRPEAEPELQRLSQLIRDEARGGVSIAGHTDSVGDDAYNLALSRRRADAVAAWLTRHGIDRGVLQTTGHGERQPIAPNSTPDGGDNPEGRQRNRRVDVVIQRARPLGR